MRKRVIRQIGLAALVISWLSPGFSALAQVAASADSQRPRLGLPIESDPMSVLSFYLSPHLNSLGSYEWPPRLAVLSRGTPTQAVGLHIFKPGRNGKLSTAFFIRPPETEEWGKLESFPSDHSYPGLVIRGNYTELAEHGGPLTIALCYFNGTFRVVFRGGYANFISITEGKMPEAVEYVSAEMESRTNTRVRVWTWDGKKYRPVAEIPYKALFSGQLIRAIEAVQVIGKERMTKPRKTKSH